MSNYQNYVKDFPSRCKRIYELAEPTMKQKELDVSLLLMVASTALTIPYERLKPEQNPTQPIQDRKHFENAAEKLNQLLEKPFLSSLLWHTENVSSWASADLASVKGTPDEWEELRNPSTMPETQTVSSVLTAIRNALAHGNLYMKAGMRGQIVSIVFVTGLKNDATDSNLKRKNGKIVSTLRFVQVSPEDFRTFLMNWIGFLGNLELSDEIIAETLNAA